MKLSLFIPGEPVPKQSARFRVVKFWNKTKRDYVYTVSSYQTKEVKAAESRIKQLVVQQLPHGFELMVGPLAVTKLIYCFPPLLTMKKADKEAIERGYVILKHTKPDASDNLAKLIFDAMEGIVYKNDSQISHMSAVWKVYSNKPGIYLIIEDIPESQRTYLMFGLEGRVINFDLFQQQIVPNLFNLTEI